MGGKIMDGKDAKEIIVKGVRVEDTQYGPRIGITDMEGKWYNSRKSKWSKLPGTWEGLTSLKAGERVHIDYEVKPYTAKDGSTKTTNEIMGFDIIIRPQDEVRPVTAPSSVSQCIPGETTPSTVKLIVPETGARQTCLNCATQIVGSWVEKSDLTQVDSVVAVAKQIYAALKEAW
jgi:hypothetical protein